MVFITRGCIRNCKFCIVPKKEGGIRKVNTIDRIVKHKQVKFLDNNILAYDGHKDILQELIDKKIRCQFNQGLDIRLIDEENSELLRKLNYIDEYIFAFDDWKLKNIIVKKLEIMKWANHWKTKFFLYANADMKLSNIINRIEFLRRNKCLIYFMRDRNCYYSKNKKFYSLLNSYASWHSYLKTMDFFIFLRDYIKLNKKDLQKYTFLYYKNFYKSEI